MAVKDQNQNEQAQQPSSSFGTAQPQSAPRQQQSGGFDWATLSARDSTPIGRSVQDAIQLKLTDAFNLLVKGASSQGVEIKILSQSADDSPALVYGVIALTMTSRQINPNAAAYYTLIMEATGDELQPDIVQINGQNIEVLRLASESDDYTQRDEVDNLVRRTLSQQEVIDSGAMVVPRGFDVDDNEAVHRLARAVLESMNNALQCSVPDFRDLNVADAGNDSRLTVRPVYNNSKVTLDATGLPVRSDLVISMTASKNNQGNQGVRPSKATPLTTLSGYIDTIYQPGVRAQIPGQYAIDPVTGTMIPMSNLLARTYVPNLVITEVETRLPTMNGVLLALITAVSVCEQRRWEHYFYAKQFDSANDQRHMYNLGVLGIEAGVAQHGEAPSAIDMSTVDPVLHSQLLAAMYTDSIVVSMDVNEAGANSGRLGIFAMAAYEGAAGQEATRRILAAADQLTNGNFKRYYNGGPVAIDGDNRIYRGYYESNHGVRRDIRDIDYVAVANIYASKDPNILRRWSDARWATNVDPRLRQRDALQILSGAVNGNVVITGYDRRITLNPDFLIALSLGAKDAGFQAGVQYPYVDTGAGERARAQFGQDFMFGNRTTGVFNQGFSQNRQFGNNAPNNTFNRFG